MCTSLQVEMVVRLWKDGFTVNDEDFRSYSVPENQDFLDAIKRGWATSVWSKDHNVVTWMISVNWITGTTCEFLSFYCSPSAQNNSDTFLSHCQDEDSALCHDLFSPANQKQMSEQGYNCFVFLVLLSISRCFCWLWLFLRKCGSFPAIVGPSYMRLQSQVLIH